MRMRVSALSSALQSSRVKAMLLIIGLCAAFLALRSQGGDFSHLSAEKLKATIDSYGIGGPLVYIVVYVVRIFFLVPAGIAVAAAGAIWGPFKGFVIAMIAALITATIEFLAARYFARAAVAKLLAGRMTGLDATLERRGFLAVLLVRLVPAVPFDIQNFGFGLTKIRFRDYFWATTFGIMPASFALVYFGESVLSVLGNPQNIWKLGVAVILLAGLYFLRQWLRSRQTGQKD